MKSSSRKRVNKKSKSSSRKRVASSSRKRVASSSRKRVASSSRKRVASSSRKRVNKKSKTRPKIRISKAGTKVLRTKKMERCIMAVKVRSPSRCFYAKKWVGGKGCYNPWAVCNKSVGRKS